MSAQSEIEKLRTLQESFDNLAEKAQIVVIDPDAYMPCDLDALDAWWAEQPTDKEITE